MTRQTKRGASSVATSGHAAADGLIAANAELGTWCFKLNGHGGLIFGEQADFFHKGELAQQLLEHLREHYVVIVNLDAAVATLPTPSELTVTLERASALLKALFETPRPKTAPIHKASTTAAAALDLLDDFCDSLHD